VQALYLAADRCSQATVAVSDVVRDRLVRWGVPAGKITVVPNALEFSRVAFDPGARARVREQLGIPPAATVIGVLGRLDPNKRVDLVIRAAAPLLREDRVLLIVGDGEERDHLADTVRDVGVGAHVVFAGERQDVGPVLSSFDMFVVASAQETFGLAVLEALGNGLPVLYTTCPALDGIATDRARQVPGEEDALRRELATELQRPLPPREPVTALLQRYGIHSAAARIDGLYERLRSRGTEPRRDAPPARPRDEDLSASR
jgi:glycosyltransferase involved in cell wall biosynthesis